MSDPVPAALEQMERSSESLRRYVPEFKHDSAIFHTLFILHFQRDLHSRYIPLVDLYTVQITNRPSLPIVYTLTTEPSAAHSYGSNPVIVF